MVHVRDPASIARSEAATGDLLDARFDAGRPVLEVTVVASLASGWLGVVDFPDDALIVEPRSWNFGPATP